MTEFRSQADIGNRALQHCGAVRMDETLGFLESSKNASEVAFAYGKLRTAELRRNTWRFAIKRVILRPIDTNTMLLTPSLWSSLSTYFIGSIVADSSGNLWISTLPSNINNEPGTVQAAWDPYYGPLSVSLFTTATTYFSGELVYTAVGDGTYRVYLSLQNANADVPGTATAWDATVTYSKNAVVTFSAVAYMSLVDLNLNQSPSTHPAAWTTSFIGGAGSVKWLEIGGAEFPAGVGLATITIVYPIGTGPSTQTSTRNVFRLPNGFLRQAPSDPKAGSFSYVGAPSNLYYDDWVFEGDYLVSSYTNPIMLRFVADVTDVRRMDPMFCEGLAARIGLEVCEPLTQSTAKIGMIAKIYEKWIGDARTVNGIEVGAEEPPLDDYIACRY